MRSQSAAQISRSPSRPRPQQHQRRRAPRWRGAPWRGGRGEKRLRLQKPEALNSIAEQPRQRVQNRRVARIKRAMACLLLCCCRPLYRASTAPACDRSHSCCTILPAGFRYVDTAIGSAGLQDGGLKRGFGPAPVCRCRAVDPRRFSALPLIRFS